MASGACDVALGCEKLKDTGYGGLPQRTRGVTNDMYWRNLSAPGMFAQLAAGKVDETRCANRSFTGIG